jgi:Ca2+-binding EF-hand superfamily protein
MDNLPKLSDDEMEMCKKAFMMFDKDGNESIMSYFLLDLTLHYDT